MPDAFHPAPHLPPPILAPPRLAPPRLPAPVAPVPAPGFVASVGHATRTARRQISGLPAVTATADAIAARHCVDLLAQRLKDDPGDPERHVWLAEALMRAKRDMRQLRRARTAGGVVTGAGVGGLVMRLAMTRMARLGAGDVEEPSVRLLRRAFALAGPRVHVADPDPAALHVLARVYLARGRPADALRLARLASAKLPSQSGDVLVTAARAYSVLGRHEDAARMATSAVEHGSTVGYEVLAHLRLADRSPFVRQAVERLKEWRDLRRQVRREDRARYYGAARGSTQIATAVTSAQWAKTATTFAEAVDIATRTRGSLLKEMNP